MILRVARFVVRPDVAEETVEKFRAWISEQPGFCGGFHAIHPDTGECVSIAAWDSLEHLAAFREKDPPFGRVGITPAQIDTYEVEAAFGAMIQSLAQR